MDEAERIWSEKSEVELIEAAADLDQFTAEGQRIIRAELKRRGLEDPVEQAAIEPDAGPSDDEATEPECLRCHVKLHLVDPDDPESAERWTWLGDIKLPRLVGNGLDIYVCPRCGHVDFFAALPDEEEAQEDPGDDPTPPTGGGGWAPG
jgi:hypothetical protein